MKRKEQIKIQAPNFGLRERKAAIKRLALLDAMLDRLREQNFDQISVKALCAEVGLSEPTFFNYFGAKIELLVFYVRLWSVEVGLLMAQEGGSAFDQLQTLFLLTGDAVIANHRAMTEIIAYQLRSTGPPKMSPPTRADKALRFPHMPEAADTPHSPVQKLVSRALSYALRDGELPSNTDLSLATRLVLSLFFGGPVSSPDKENLPLFYKQGLEIIWYGLGGQITQTSNNNKGK